MWSSTRCSCASLCICAASPRPSASSTPMPAPAATTWPARRRGVAANGGTGSTGSCARRSQRARALIAPYLDAVAACNGAGPLTAYPGSPALVRAFLRAQDRLIACELEPNAAASLARHLAGDRRSKAVAIDGWTALNAYVPPKERRGLVLVDPAFEDAGDFARLAQALAAAHRKWASGIYLAWYPIKERTATRVSACGLIVINPPWTLAGELAMLLPALARILSAAGEGSHRVNWLAR